MLSSVGSSLGGLSMSMSVVDGLGGPLLVGPLEGSPELLLQVGERVESYGSEMSAVWILRLMPPTGFLVSIRGSYCRRYSRCLRDGKNQLVEERGATNLRTPGILAVGFDVLWMTKKTRNKIYSIMSQLDSVLVD